METNKEYTHCQLCGDSVWVACHRCKLWYNRNKHTMSVTVYEFIGYVNYDPKRDKGLEGHFRAFIRRACNKLGKKLLGIDGV